MQITEITASIVDVGQGFRWAGLRARDVAAVHVNIRTDEGIQGDGLAWSGGLSEKVVVAGIEQCVAPALVGQDPWDIGAAMQTLWRAFRIGLPLPAIGVADVALWDLKARVCGQSIAALLGQQHQRLRACASAPPVDSSRDCHAMLEDILGQGFRAIKLHACGDVHVDIAVCENARALVGDEVELMMDAMAIYDRNDALLLGRCLDAQAFRWFEDPLPDDDLGGWVDLAAALDTPLAGVDAVRATTRDYARPIADGAFDIVRMDAARHGISQIDSLARMAHAFGIGCEAHAFGPALAQAANLQASLASASSRYCELPVPLGGLDFGVHQGLQLDPQGYVLAPAGPGLGLELDREAMARATLR